MKPKKTNRVKGELKAKVLAMKGWFAWYDFQHEHHAMSAYLRYMKAQGLLDSWSMGKNKPTLYKVRENESPRQPETIQSPKISTD